LPGSWAGSGTGWPLLSFGIPGGLLTLFGIGARSTSSSEFYRSGQFHYIVFYGRVCGADPWVDARDVGAESELAGDDNEGVRGVEGV